MRVIVPPVLVGDRICRIVSALESLLEVEEWVGAWWEPSDVPLTQVSSATAASELVLFARNVPKSDQTTSSVRPLHGDVEALMQPDAPERPDGMRFDEEAMVSATAPRQPLYPGNARFRRRSWAPNGVSTPEGVSLTTTDEQPARTFRHRRTTPPDASR